jgi:hypothetical protein
MSKQRTPYQQFVSEFSAQHKGQKWGKKGEFQRAAATAWHVDHPLKPRSFCAGVDQSACLPPLCGWADGKKRKYCHAKPVRKALQMGGKKSCSKIYGEYHDCVQKKAPKNCEKKKSSLLKCEQNGGGLFGKSKCEKADEQYYKCVNNRKFNHGAKMNDCSKEHDAFTNCTD